MQHLFAQIVSSRADWWWALRPRMNGKGEIGDSDFKYSSLPSLRFRSVYHNSENYTTYKLTYIKAENLPDHSRHNVSRDDLLLLAKNWLECCNQQHGHCLQLNSCLKLPTRLLSITRQNLQVISSAELPSDTKYAALSHCWGSWSESQTH